VFLKNFKIGQFLHLLLSCSVRLQPAGSRYQGYKCVAYFRNIRTQVCVVLKSSLSKAIARYRARITPFTREAIKAKVLYFEKHHLLQRTELK